ncbi:MATE family efflux transporter [Pseudooceanicola nanhaiensis]|jgi:MATE family multidrug resistance protein|uniref:Multidrug-efflux transporter n=2 Tax=Pseudooceanicola nanhaiensis TaxID=375761 RepID=A0A917SQA3_9RHOB|nr:MATE family efflux transporter [Pseudooceanicola nanhaiensis]
MTARMTYGAHVKAILALGLPLIGSHVAQFAVQMTDTFMLGWYDVRVLAGEVLGGTLFFILFIAGSGFAWAVSPLVASAEGAGDTTTARRVTRMSLWISALYACATLPLLLNADTILLALGQEPELARIADDYLSITAWAIFPALGVMVLKSHLSALERTRVVFWVTILAVLVNGLGNYMFIFGHWGAPEMGVRGAAVATVMVHTVSLLALVVYTETATPEHELFRRFWRPDREAFGTVFRLGWPIGITTVAEVGLFAMSSLMMGWIGPLHLAAHGIAIQVASVVFMIHLGLSNTATIRAGRAIGRGDAQGLRDGALVVTALSGLAALVTIAIIVAIPGPLIGLFVDPADPDRPRVIEIGTVLLYAAALFQLVDAAQVMALGLLRGVQDTRVPMIYAAISYWLIGVPCSYVLGFVLGWEGPGIWLGLAAGLAAASVFMMTRFWHNTLPAALRA